MSITKMAFLGLISVLIACILAAGCSDSSGPAPAPEQTLSAVATPSGPLYGAGDIIKNPKVGSSAALLIISYDAGTDKYDRAYVYPNSDGSWGYRVDAKTDKIDRSVIEKMYTQKVTTKTVSAITIRTPTTVATPVVSLTTSATVSPNTTATTTTARPPRIKEVGTDTGKAGTTVSITDLQGEDFRAGANVTLKKSGQTSIVATNVVAASNLITCTFVIPAGTATGYWDVVVTNPDGQYHQYMNGFHILEGTAVTTTTTTATTTTSSTAPTISSNDPAVVIGQGYYPISISGTNFSLTGIAAKLTTSGKADISASTCSMSSTSQMTCYFDIPMGSQGSWNIVVTNPGGASATKSSALTVSG
jgi:hypothetical protein